MKTIKVYFENNNFMFQEVRKRLEKYYILEESDEPDFAFVSFESSRKYIGKACVSIFLSGEPYVPDFNQVDYAISNVDLTFGNRHMYYPFYFMKGVHYKSLDMNIQESKNKFCNFIYSESCTSGNGIAYRNAFCEELMKFKNVDCLGRVMHNSNDQLLSEREDSDWEKSKIKVQAKYKFSIAFENSLEDGYITEKIIDPLIAGSLPIYFGSEYVKKFINSDSFIYANDFLNRNDGMKDLIDKVKEVEENLNLYKSYFSHTFINEGAVAEKEEELEKFLIEVIEHGIVHDKDPYNFAAKSVIRQVPLHWDITYRLNILLYKTPLLSSLWRKIKHRSLAKTRKGTTTGGKESVGDTPL